MCIRDSDDGDLADVVDAGVARDLHDGRCDILGGRGKARAVVGTKEVVVDGLGDTHDAAVDVYKRQRLVNQTLNHILRRMGGLSVALHRNILFAYKFRRVGDIGLRLLLPNRIDGFGQIVLVQFDQVATMVLLSLIHISASK